MGVSTPWRHSMACHSLACTHPGASRVAAPAAELAAGDGSFNLPNRASSRGFGSAGVAVYAASDADWPAACPSMGLEVDYPVPAQRAS